MEHRKEMKRIKYLVNRGWISKAQAIAMFQDYLKATKGRPARLVEYQYKKVA